MRFITACLLSFALCVFIGKVHAEDNYEDYQDYDDQKCSMTESIIGGTVKYSNNGFVKSEVTYFCKDGFKPYPIPQKICKPTGKWEPDISRVVCEEELDYDDIEEPQKNCSVAEIIKGGEVSYSNEGLEGSVLTYHCKIGYYAYPVSTRVCNPRGDWSVMILPNGKTVSTATCKDILCPAQLQLDNGQFWPKKQWFKIGEEQEFSCREGLTLSGSAKRNCTEWGHWTGNLPVCIDETDGCKDPGIPPGALRSGERFEIGDQVKYRCQSGMNLLGPEVRVCLDSKEWSGPEPRCQAPYVFDLPESVAQAMDGSLSAVMDVSFPELEKKRPKFARSLNVADGRLNIFILIDTSGSIQNDQFQKAKEATASLVRKLSSYDVEMKFDIISYASEPKDIIKVLDPFSDNTDVVLRKLELFTQTNHGEKTGTNLFKALECVHKRLSFLKANNKTRFSETQNVILIETDGYSNMGRDPQYVLGSIRELMGYKSRKPCQGSILTKDWVITSAHCLMRLNDGVTEWANAMDVQITYGDGIVNALLLIPHPNFNVTKLKDKNVNEFYDYDVALIKVISIKLSSKARPVCLPCTKASNRALKMSSDSTCKKHQSALLDLQQTQAYFISQGKTRKPTHIQTGEKRDDCLKQYRPEPASNNQVSLTDVITDRFLCTGGSEKYKDYITCKGDSGGSLFLRKGMRYFQVGVVSWGTKNVCDLSTSTVPDPPVDARDFHISVFSIMPWLQEQLGRDLEFIPN
ncbi:complement factor B isoform X1 [Tachysurus ichikawai]